MRLDYIITRLHGAPYFGTVDGAVPTLLDSILRRLSIVVEPYPVRVLAADCPITIVFKLSHLSVFHLYVVAIVL